MYKYRLAAANLASMPTAMTTRRYGSRRVTCSKSGTLASPMSKTTNGPALVVYIGEA